MKTKTIYQNYNATNAVPSGKCIAINTFKKKNNRSQIKSITLQLKELKREQTKPKTRRRKELNIREQRKIMRLKPGSLKDPN